MAKFEITAPAQEFSGEFAGVVFTRGRATADSEKDATALGYFRRKGYVVTPTEETEPDSPAAVDAPPSASSSPFDPAAHSVDEVLAHLEAADLDEAERVLQAESDGKARKSILTPGGPLLARKEQGAQK